MAIGNESENGMVMPVQPMYGGYGNGGGFGFGGDSSWIVLFLLFAVFGGWGGGGYGGFDSLYPWMNNSQNINDGFRDQMLNTQVMGIGNAVTSGFGDVQNALCGGFAGVNASIANGFAQSEIANNARQMANLQQDFAMQSQLASCCCENRLASADLKYTIANEACNDRQAVTNALEAVIANQTANTQRILDQMCNDKIDAKNAEIMSLERQLAMANLAASQTAQTAEILAKLPASTAA